MAHHQQVEVVPRTASTTGAGFFESLPLLVGAVALFLAALTTWLAGIHVGPAEFPLWAMLLVAGFIACIGVVISWFYAVGPNDQVREQDRSAPTQPPERTRPGRESVSHRADRGEDSRGLSPPPPAPWDEGPPSPAPVASPRARDSRGEDEETNGVFDELDRIQEELGTRRRDQRTTRRSF